MNMRFFVYSAILTVFVAASSCRSQNGQNKQGLTGELIWVEGNQMPPTEATGKPAQRTVLIYEPTSLDDTEGQAPLFTKINSKLIARTSSNASGKFKVSLPAGKYSIFIEEKNKYYANSFNSQNFIQIVDIKESEWLKIEISINYSASF